ncbi:hypothetical protein BWQ93_14135 [Sphingopyxis sp. QXT-31]|uniref:hypothetical protein n=1 Tax=Sphingopyxis sp. QXT-31 TaxID=1357916 RepID=UPI0009793B63|nr:hypothetical protein [Sphingopyxis sp. QXT-31]APZ99496.1 hypothetical protein BWQ93_14135 [Sphingopyxis sp. QXT-31]
MSGWWVAAGCVGLFLIFAFFAARSGKRRAAALAATRISPSREEFIALLSDDCEPDIAAFVWTIFTEEYSYWDAGLTPHPDDNYLGDMPINPENEQDWLGDFCAAEDLRPKDFPHWPEGWKTTVRNFARWLSEARRSIVRAVA